MNKKNKKIVYPSFDKYLAMKLKDPKFKQGYERESRRFEIAYRINHLRRKQKLSQKQLAKKLETTQSVVARMETGQQNFTLNTLQKIAAALNYRLKIDFVK